MLVAHIITGLFVGGAEGTLFRLVTSDTESSHVVISLMGPGYYGPLAEQSGVSIYCLNMPRGRLKVNAIIRLTRILLEIKPDVVQTWMYHADLIGGVVARACGIPRIFWGVRNSTLVVGKSQSSTIGVAKLCALISGFIPTGIVSCATSAKAVHVKMGYDTRKFAVIHNGIDTARYRFDRAGRDELRKQWGITDATTVVGMVARFDAQKDYETFFQALSILHNQGHDFFATAIGEGVEGGCGSIGLLNADRNLRKRVFLSSQRSDIVRVLSALDIHVLSSQFGEAFPNVLAEAMSCNTPCVATNVGDSEAIIGGTGWVVAPRDPVALANAILEAMRERLQDRRMWDARRAQARTRIELNFGLQGMCKSYNQLWRQS